MIMNSASTTSTTGVVSSADGTKIGYRQLGSGPGLIILHGGALASRNYLKLGTLLADEFTVYLQDRRGRGNSGPYRDDHSIRTEDADLAALIHQTGAHYAFGTADGGLFALHAALSTPELEKVAAYEPVVFAGQPGQAEFAESIEQFEHRISSGDVLGAAVGLTKNAAVPRWIRLVPDGLMRAAFALGFWIDERRAPGGYALGKDLLPTLAPELAMVRDTEGTLDAYRELQAAVLLLRGRRSEPLITGSIEALQKIIPNYRSAVLPGLIHGSAQDTGGRPQVIADAIRDFFRS
jgi:pimeloyl-ACP methyl ester carboxylesterase